MHNYKIQTPIAFFIYNRSECTARVLKEIAHVKPAKLLIIADGPKEEQRGDYVNCTETRAIIETNIDWPCDVMMNYSSENLGCKIRLSSGLDWVFNNVEEAIILEDDCLPHPTFFRFCDEMLAYYRGDERIKVISGNNFQHGNKRTKYSYYFSRYVHIWGWASWSQAWQNYDVEMRLWPIIRDNGWLEDILIDAKAIKYWTDIFQSVYQGEIDTWDYQWVFACWVQNGMSILPNVNLVSNIGFTPGSTHTTNAKNIYANLPLEAMDFPIQHPPFVIRDSHMDDFTQNTHYNRYKIFARTRGKIRELSKKKFEFIDNKTHSSDQID